MAELPFGTIKNKQQYQQQQQQCFIYELVIASLSPCSPFIIGKVKHQINLQQLLSREDCYHNEAAYKKKLERDGWSNNYTSLRSREIFDCHFIDYVEIIDSIEFNIKILFFTMKAGELLIPIVIKNDNQIINIIRNHIMIDNNIGAPVYHNYRIELLCKEIAKGEILDLRYTGHPSCNTSLYNYQRDSIMRAIEIEKEISEKKLKIDFTEHKLLFMNDLGLVFDYNLCGGDNCFIRRDELPKVLVFGGIIADEVGLGKTIQALNLALSLEGIRTLIIVPNHIKDHWLSEMHKHFSGNPFDGLVLIVTVSEALIMPDDVMNRYQRLIVDELAELYTKGRPENNNLFVRLCGNSSFQYRWGITATPFVNDLSMYNIIRFLLGNYSIYTSAVGNYTYIQDQFKPLFLKNIKANVALEVKLPEVIIHNSALTFSEHERSILTAMEMDTATFSVDDLLRIISNAMLEMTNNEKTIITVKELEQLTVQRFQEKIVSAKSYWKDLITKQHNIQLQRKELTIEYSLDIQKFEGTVSNTIGAKSKNLQAILSEYQNRERHLELEIETALKILERREQVHKSYLEMTQHINNIIHSAVKARKYSQCDSAESSDSVVANTVLNGNTVISDSGLEEMDFNTMINEDRMCPICYCPFSENIVLFIKCRHYFCQGCFERCHKQRPNTCPMCRTPAEIGEINYIGVENCVITSTKNTEILRLLNTYSKERFIIFTRFDSFIQPLIAFLLLNDIATQTLNEYKASTSAVQDTTRVILLSANSNASGTDMTFMHRVIIIEPFESYIYGKEIEKQLIGRIHRINQTNNVYVYRLYIKATIEEKIYALG